MLDAGERIGGRISLGGENYVEFMESRCWMLLIMKHSKFVLECEANAGEQSPSVI